MFDPDSFAIFVGAVVVLMVTPGPDMLFITANGIAQGPRAGVVSALGVGVGSLVHTAAAAIGLSALIQAEPLALDIICYGGAAYLAWLGVQAIRNPAMLDVRVARARTRSLQQVFRAGVMCNLLNPKVVAFFVTFLPQFVDPARGSIAVQLAVLGIVLTVIGTAFNALVGLSGGNIGRFLARRPGYARVQSWVSGLVFIGLAVRLALTGRHAA